VPNIDLTQKRKQLLGLNKEKFGGRYIFDGASLYMSQNVPNFEFQTDVFDGKVFNISVRKTGSVQSGDPESFQIYNMIFREAMAGLKLQNVKRDYYDPQAKVRQTSNGFQMTLINVIFLFSLRLMFQKDALNSGPAT
jgi:hypothetical protein